MEDEDTLVERKKQELKQWFAANYKHEVSQKLAAQSSGIGDTSGTQVLD